MDERTPRPLPTCIQTFSGDTMAVQELTVGADFFLVVADLNAAKDTVTILRDLQAAFPVPSCDIHRGVHELLGPLNTACVHSALEHIAAGRCCARLPHCDSICST